MIRLATEEDLNTIVEIYAIARRYMEENGNATQWTDSYPDRELLERDIQSEQLFVYVENHKIHGVFAFIIGPDATYSRIESGAWKNENLYGTIHRVASDGAVKGVFSRCVEFCKQKISNLRIDTHNDNHTMRHVIMKNGFEKCGIIYVQNGTPRIAYQYSQVQ
jgi:hypothetical protein